MFSSSTSQFYEIKIGMYGQKLEKKKHVKVIPPAPFAEVVWRVSVLPLPLTPALKTPPLIKLTLLNLIFLLMFSRDSWASLNRLGAS